jgi:hypothetical protein
MKIDHENIEAYLLDYLTGQLSWGESVAVQKFLEEHPDFDPGKSALVFLPYEEVVFHKKELLKKNFRFDAEPEYLSDEEQKERLLFLLSEDPLLPDDERKLKELSRQDEKFKKEAEIALNTRFHAEKNIIFSNKQNLKKKSRKRRIVAWPGFAAASLLITLISYLFQERSTSSTVQHEHLKQNEVRLSGKKKNMHDTSAPDHPGLERPSFKREPNYFYLSMGSNQIEQDYTNASVLNSELNAFSNSPDQKVQDSSLNLTESLQTFNDTIKTINDQLATREADFPETDHFNYMVNPQKQNLGIQKIKLFSKEKGTKSFHIRLGKFFFSYSKTLTKSNL